MKKGGFLVSLALIALCTIGWLSVIFGTASTGIAYSNYVKKGDSYVERKLYQRAVETYNLALEEKETRKVYEKIDKAYALRLKENPKDDKTFEAYKKFLKAAVAKYPGNHQLVDSMVEIYTADEKYGEMYKMLKTAISSGYDTKEVRKKLLEAQYSFTLRNNDFLGVREADGDTFAVKVSTGWRIYQIGEGYIVAEQFDYVSAFDEENIFVAVKEDASCLMNTDGMVLGKFKSKVDEAGVYAEGLVPVCIGGVYKYYNEFAEEQFGEYDMAGMFQDGLAAVKKGNKWVLVNDKGKVKSETFDEIVVDYLGRYVIGDVVIAKRNGKYGIYSNKMKLKAQLDCEDVDIPSNDGKIAVCKNGKWGFVNNKGKLLIKPQYEKAKSYANGLAAVCENGNWGFIDMDGNLVIGYQFSDVGYMRDNGMCFVRTDNKKQNAKSDEAADKKQEPEKTETQKERETAESWKILKLTLGLDPK